MILLHRDQLHVGALPDDAPAADALRDALVRTVKHLAHSRLSATDWYVTRLAETDEPIPAEVEAERAAIRAWAEDREAAINAAADDAAMLAVDLKRPA